MFLLSGCALQNEPNASQLESIELSPDISSISLEYFQSNNLQINVGYPTGWSIEEGNRIIRLTPQDSEEHQVAKISYEIYMIDPYVDRGNRRLGIPQSATKIAQGIADTFLIVDELNTELIQPVESVLINGKLGASFSLTYGSSRQMYIIVLPTDKEQATILSASGLAIHYSEMQKFLNLIALNTLRIEGD